MPTCIRNTTPSWRFNWTASEQLWRAPALVAVSIAAYEPEWFLLDLLQNAVTFSEPSTRLVLHYNCNPEPIRPSSTPHRGDQPSWAVLEQASDPFRGLPKRVELNPECVTVRKFCGSILHAHVLNIQYIERRTAPSALPKYIVLQASNSRWIRPGWEAHVARHESSIIATTRVNPSPPVPKEGKGSLLTQLTMQLSNGTSCYSYFDHEGAFLPFDRAISFSRALPGAIAAASGRGSELGLSTLDAARGAFEEYALPTYVASRLVVESAASDCVARASKRVVCMGLSPGELRVGCATTLTRFDGLIGTVRNPKERGIIQLPLPSIVQALRKQAAQGVYSLKLLDRSFNSPILLSVAKLGRLERLRKDPGARRRMTRRGR